MYATLPACFDAAFAAARAALLTTLLGPTHGGTYSPSVQRTLFLMGQALLEK